MNHGFKGLVGLAAAGLLSIASVDAEACGGLFCDSQQPVNQAAERIIFADNPDGTVTAVVQILYEGPSENFAWVLPVPSVPEVGVSSNVAFQRLQQATNPSYRMTLRVEGECRTDEGLFASSDNASARDFTNNANGANSQDDGVTVLDSGIVGPYDYTVIEIDDMLDAPEQVALDWLDTNGYDVSALGPNVIRPYLDDGMYLLAFRLTKNADTGSIRPVTLNYETDVPMIPIKLTAVAANEDMGVLVWVLGDSRAVPVNYKSLVLNEALLNWFNPGSNYDDVVIAAANEADGQGFVTELASTTAQLDDIVWSDWEASRWRDFQARASSIGWSTPGDALCEAFNLFIGYDGWTETVDEFVSGLSAAERDSLKSDACGQRGIVPTTADTAVLIELLDENVVKPMLVTEGIVSGAAYVTRMYTTMSAAEMTVDPLFDFNADLGDHSNLHSADRIIECNDNYYQFEAPWRVELENGDIVRGFGTSWPIGPDQVPANRLITQDSTSGDAMVVVDNTATIRQALKAHNDEILSQIDDGCGCASVDGRFPGELLLLALGLFGIRRIRR